MLAANGTLRIFAQLQFAEAHGQSVKEKQAPDERIALADDELQRFSGLNRSDNSRKDAEHAAFRAGRHQAGRRRLGIQAAIARAGGISEYGDLAFEAEN